MTDTTDLAALKPCPFCGGEGMPTLTQAAGMEWGQVECINESCRATGPTPATEAEAIATWNTRAADQQALAERDAEIARLRELVDQAAQIIGQIELDHRYPPAPDSMDRRIERARFWLHVYAALGGTDAE